MKGAVVVLALLVVVGCARPPDLPPLYAEQRGKERYPVIVIPGMMGSRLASERTGEVVWDVSLWRLLTGKGFDRLALPVDSPDFRKNRDDLIPAGLVYDSLGVDFYRGLVDTLTEAGGYTCVSPEDLDPGTDCVLFAWDWRRDLVEAAVGLGQIIDRIRVVRGRPDLKVDVVAHSAGGLIARYYARFGERDVLDLDPTEVKITLAGAAKLRNVVLIGTPNLGSIEGLQRIMMGTEVGLANVGPELTATMPSVFELMPHPDQAWMVDDRGRRIERDLYDPETWRLYEVSVYNPDVRLRIRKRFASGREADAYLGELERFFARALERGRRFQRALSIPVRDLPARYIVFGADCRMTPAICLLESAGGRPQIRLRPDEVANRVKGIDYDRLMLEPGDGDVTRTSLLARQTLDAESSDDPIFPIDRLVMTCEDHARLPGDFTLRHNLLTVLLY